MRGIRVQGSRHIRSVTVQGGMLRVGEKEDTFFSSTISALPLKRLVIQEDLFSPTTTCLTCS